MIRHIVLFKIKEEYKKDIPGLVEDFYSMKGRIEGMTDLFSAADFLHSGRSYDIALITDFETEEAFEGYPTHPVHAPIKAHMHEVMESSVSCDMKY